MSATLVQTQSATEQICQNWNSFQKNLQVFKSDVTVRITSGVEPPLERLSDYEFRKVGPVGVILGDAKNTQDDHFYNDDSAKKDDEDTD